MSKRKTFTLDSLIEVLEETRRSCRRPIVGLVAIRIWVDGAYVTIRGMEEPKGNGDARDEGAHDHAGI